MEGRMLFDLEIPQQHPLFTYPPQQQVEDPAPPAKQPASASASPWQRMKWTDSMVRLLIMVVYCVGDDGNGNHEAEPKGKKTPSSAAGLLLQKKGKWKSVSRAMMEKGFYVSPQQCEDKFNDLNKRYKRVNDLLGKGTACRVVENQALLETMDHLSAKAKEEARKLLNSKHLFFREMCAYHNGGGSSSCQQAPPVQEQHEQCSHQAVKRAHVESDEDDDGDEDGDNDDMDEYDDDEEKEHKSSKRARTSMMSPSMSASPPLSLSLSATTAATSSMQQLKNELFESLASVGGEQQQRQWLKRKALELEEQQLGFKCQGLELERQRFKWLRFCSNKEREMEKAKLHNERLCLENNRMLLLLHQKEQELNANGNSNFKFSN